MNKASKTALVFLLASGCLFAVRHTIADAPPKPPEEAKAAMEAAPAKSAEDNDPYFYAYKKAKPLGKYETFAQALAETEKTESSAIRYETKIVWAKAEGEAGAKMLDVPLILQNPDLPRGCEVTSLAMLLRYAGVPADKMDLAAEIEKTPFKADGLYGNPNKAFVGDMFDETKPGYAVYHGPIKALAEKHLPGRVIDATGAHFEDMLGFVAKGKPVWAIANALFKKLPEGALMNWETGDGEVAATWYEHAVLITGFDQDNVYINNPLDENGKNQAIPKADFKEAWEQMGSQAVTYVD